jgi:hypothetical protein
LLLNPDVILGHATIGEPLFELVVAAAGTTDLINFSHASTAMANARR